MRLGPIFAMLVLTAFVIYVAIAYGPGIEEWISDPQTLEAIGGQADNALTVLALGGIGVLGGLSTLALLKYLNGK